MKAMGWVSHGSVVLFPITSHRLPASSRGRLTPRVHATQAEGDVAQRGLRLRSLAPHLGARAL